MAYLDTVAGTAREGGISTAAIDAGALSADASGRAVVADGFFNAATSALKFAAQGFAHSLLALRAVEAHTAGDTLLSTDHVMCGVAGTWNVMGFTGTWTAV